MFGFAAEAVSCAQLQEFHTVVNCYIKSAKNGYFGKIQRHENCSKLPLSKVLVEQVESLSGAKRWLHYSYASFTCVNL